MAMLQAADPVYAYFRDSLAVLGMVVIGIEFRNSGGKLGNHPFPAGLNDCLSGLQWTFANKAKLGISHIVLSGESGGGNLALATCLKAKSIDQLGTVDGVYVMCPMIFNANKSKSAEFPSQVENDGYFINYPTIQLCASLYDPDNTEADNPLCWPIAANKVDLAGLPPHMISVNEMDLFRDEGLTYYRNLLAAGVKASSRTVNGTCHSADVILPNAAPDIFAATLWDIYGFTHSLSTTK
jgi:acetyl esterase/lipase